MLYRSLRWVFRRLPISPHRKLLLKNVVYERLGSWFGDQLGYRNWERSRAAGPRLPKFAPASPPDQAAWRALARQRHACPPRDARDVNPYVVVPVYQGLSETLVCLHSVLSSDPSTTVVVVDDASPDARLSEALGELAALGLVELLRHDTNRGFVAAANAGLSRDPGRDVVLLNSDVQVFPGWLDGLSKVAHAQRDIGTVTPLTNNGEICSYPEWLANNDCALELGDAELAALAGTVNRQRWVDAPTGVGFCLYIRRDCLDAVGRFDEGFAPGYGEETDFCLRARARGWRNVISGEVFVRHLGGVSFGASAQVLRAQAQERLEQRHPGYAGRIRDYLAEDPAAVLRTRLDAARLRRVAAHGSSRHDVLFVTHGQGGGVERHVRELKHALESEEVNVYVMRPSERHEGRVRIEPSGLAATPSTLCFAMGAEDHLLLDTLSLLEIGHVHIHHLAGYGADAPAWAVRWLAELGVPYDVTAHDYLPVCPRITLIDASGRYCGEPEVAACERCVAKSGSPLGRLNVALWRERWSSLLAGARRVFCPSRDTEQRLLRHFPDAETRLRPHPELWGSASERLGLAGEASPAIDGVRRVAVVGALGPEKGAGLLLACARDAARRGLPVEFRVVGYTDRDPELSRTGKVELTGPYEDPDLRRLLASQGCSIAFYPSLWPETWCYALTASLDLQLYTVAFDLGAQAERIRSSGWGELLPVAQADDPAAVNDSLLAIDLTAKPPARIAEPSCPGPRTAEYYEGFEA